MTNRLIEAVDKQDPKDEDAEEEDNASPEVFLEDILKGRPRREQYGTNL